MNKLCCKWLKESLVVMNNVSICLAFLIAGFLCLLPYDTALAVESTATAQPVLPSLSVEQPTANTPNKPVSTPLSPITAVSTPSLQLTTPQIKPIITPNAPTNVSSASLEGLFSTDPAVIGARVSPFPFAKTTDVSKAITDAPVIIATANTVFPYLLPASKPESPVAISALSGSTVGAASQAKPRGRFKQFWYNLFHKKPKKPPASAVYQLNSPWANGKIPNPTLPERQLIGFIQRTNTNWDANNAHVLAHWLVDASNTYEVDYRVLASLLAVESSFRPDAVSATGAKGLGQLKDATAQWLGVANAFDPYQNIQGAAKYLQYLGQLFPNDPAKAVGSYYVGQGTVQRQGLTEAASYYVGKVEKFLLPLLSEQP
jgi:hypothetical protein